MSAGILPGAERKSQCLHDGALALGISSSRPGRTVLVTGGARRIGRAICETLAARGWRVVVHSRRADDPDASALAERLGGIALSADLSEPLAAAHLFQAACDVAPDISAIVNNAAVFHPGDGLPPETAARIMRINAEAPERLTTLLGLRLMEHPPFHGAVVNLLDCRVVPPSQAADTPFMASKRTLRDATLKYAGLFASSLRVNAVAPGPVLPPVGAGVRVPGGDILLPARPTPQDVADAVAFLLDAPSITGQILAVDSGQSLMV